MTLIDNPGSSQDDKAAAKAGDLRIASENQHPKSPEMEPVRPTAMGPTDDVDGTKPAGTTPNEPNPPSTQVDQPHLIEAAITEITRNAILNDTTYVEGEIFCYTALYNFPDCRFYTQHSQPT